ncbi:MAG: nitroreductase family deazaflavin-dependent oxidoreductase [Acidimicrobiales bacterium]
MTIVAALDRLQSGFLVFHQWVYEASGGRVGHRLIGVPTLLLHTTGAKTGQPRTAALVYAMDGADYVVVASNGGADTPPGWLANVRAAPEVSVQVATRRLSVTASVLVPGDEDYASLWRLVNDNNHGRYDAYQAKTQRPIALVRLSPAG